MDLYVLLILKLLKDGNQMDNMISLLMKAIYMLLDVGVLEKKSVHAVSAEK